MVLELRDPPSASASGSAAQGTTTTSRRSAVYRLRRTLERSLLRSFRFPTLKPTATRKTSDLPIRFRPAFVALTFLCLILLALLGFHPTLSGKLGVHDKLQHFVGLGTASALFYWVIEVEDAARRRHWVLRHLPEILTGFVCFFGGGLLSEVVQSTLPYKTFQWGDVLANLLGSSLGLYISRTLAQRRRHRRELATLYQPLDDLDLSDEEEMDESPEMLESPQDRRTRAKENNVWDDAESEIFSLGGDEGSDDEHAATAKPPPTPKKATVAEGQEPV